MKISIHSGLFVTLSMLCIGLIGYDMYDNARFAADRQHTCDTLGC